MWNETLNLRAHSEDTVVIQGYEEVAGRLQQVAERLWKRQISMLPWRYTTWGGIQKKENNSRQRNSTNEDFEQCWDEPGVLTGGRDGRRGRGKE